MICCENIVDVALLLKSNAYAHNIFYNNFRTNPIWHVIIDSKLSSSLTSFIFSNATDIKYFTTF